MKFNNLSEKQQQALIDNVKKNLKCLLWCSRDWNAWSTGTMTDEDFIPANDDDDFAYDILNNLFEEFKTNPLEKVVEKLEMALTSGSQIEFKCPHCGKKMSERVWDTDNMDPELEELKTLWKCDSCFGFFVAKYELTQLVKLKEI
jgi:predicted RNA-binding Zn-ribbon protein involved in translation (DUF1610 family)